MGFGFEKHKSVHLWWFQHRTAAVLLFLKWPRNKIWFDFAQQKCLWRHYRTFTEASTSSAQCSHGLGQGLQTTASGPDAAREVISSMIKNNMRYFWKVCWFGTLQHIPQHSHCVWSTALDVFCITLCGREPWPGTLFIDCSKECRKLLHLLRFFCVWLVAFFWFSSKSQKHRWNTAAKDENNFTARCHFLFADPVLVLAWHMIVA